MIYIVQAEGTPHVKIGHTNQSVTMRLKSLQSENFTKLTILRTLEGERRHEQLLHQWFAPQRIRNEFFHFDPSMLTIEIIRCGYQGRARPWWRLARYPHWRRDFGSYLDAKPIP